MATNEKDVAQPIICILFQDTFFNNKNYIISFYQPNFFLYILNYIYKNIILYIFDLFIYFKKAIL